VLTRRLGLRRAPLGREAPLAAQPRSVPTIRTAPLVPDAWWPSCTHQMRSDARDPGGIAAQRDA
jgi:hypothetical protein